MRIAIILGTRPEILKMSPIIRECERLGLDYFILHTGQHYSYELDGIFFEQLKLPKPKYNLGVGSGTYAEEVSKMLLGIEKILLSEKPDIVLVEGDTNSALAGALATSKCGIAVGHIEAGLRSYYSGMPEEINRVLIDHCSSYLFAPTENAKEILLSEGISNGKIFVTGNTIVDAVRQTLGGIKPHHSLYPQKYALATVHRQENVDNKERFTEILEGLKLVSDELNLLVYYPIHPRARKMIDAYGLDVGNVKVAEPMDYLRFLLAEGHANLVLTDSGGVQEESCILGVPCVTLRDNTERPETVDVGANMLAGASSDRILMCAKIMIDRNGWEQPFGDGNSAQRIIEILRGIYG